MDRQYGYNKSFNTERIKSVDFFLNKFETETKLQSFNDLLKGFWDFT